MEEAKKKVTEVTDRAREAYDSTRSSMKPFEQQIRAFAEERPLVALGAAAAIGFLFGRMARGASSWTA